MFLLLFVACSLVLSSPILQDNNEMKLLKKCVLTEEEMAKFYAENKDKNIQKNQQHLYFPYFILPILKEKEARENAGQDKDTKTLDRYFKTKIDGDGTYFWVNTAAFEVPTFYHCKNEILNYTGAPELFLKTEGILSYSKRKFLGGRELLDHLNNIWVEKAYKKNTCNNYVFYELQGNKIIEINYPNSNNSQNTFIIDKDLNNERSFVYLSGVELNQISADENIINYISTKEDKFLRNLELDVEIFTEKFLKNETLYNENYRMRLGLPLLLLKRKQGEFFQKLKCLDYPRFVKDVYSGGKELAIKSVEIYGDNSLLDLFQAFLFDRKIENSDFPEVKNLEKKFPDAEKKFVENCKG